MNIQPTKHSQGIQVLLRVACVLAAVFLTAAVAVGADKKFTLVIDAGHGGNDAGAIGSLTKEKTINLNVALAFGRLVERNCSDVRVVYTRTTDVFVPLHTRAEIANRAKADLFVSIHTNSLPKGRIARGIETYTLGMHRANDNLEVAKRENSVILIEKDYKQRYQGFDPNSAESYIMFEFIQDRNMAQSVELAKSVQKHLCAQTGRQNKGVKQAGFLVLRETSMPSCLIELGFISTPDEERFLHSSQGVQQLARGIYEAFRAYRAPAKRKSRIAQELADVREGLAAAESTPSTPAAIDADSILQSVPDEPEVVPLPERQQAAVSPAQGQVQPSAQQAQAAVQPSAQQAQGQVQAAAQQAQGQAQAAAQQAQGQVQAAAGTGSSRRPVSASTPSAADSAPVFKVQILASGRRLKAGDPQLKGRKDAVCYQDGGLFKYTVGDSHDYNEIYRLRKTLVSAFPQCFIIAFKNGVRTDVQAAIREFKER